MPRRAEFHLTREFTILRAIRYRDLLLRDLSDHLRAPGFFTAAAATCVLGTQLLVITGAFGVATALWTSGAALWVLLTSGIFTAPIVKEDKPPVAEGITGAWLIAVVATQSVAWSSKN